MYYTRKHGEAIGGNFIGIPRAETGRIETPQEWAPLIRRCVRRDRETLLALIEASIEGRRDAPLLTDRLAAWHAAAHAAFLGLVPLSPVAEHLACRHYALSYGFELTGPESRLDHAQLPELLRRVVFELQPMFRGVMIMFDPPYRRAVRPRFAVDDAADGGETDFLEVAWLRDRPPNETADFWRVSPAGSPASCATMRRIGRRPISNWGCSAGRGSVRTSWCRRSPSWCVMRGHWPGSLPGRGAWISRRMVGAGGRELFDPQTSWAHRGAASDDHRIVTTQATAAGLAQAWPDVVARIMAPVLRAFEPVLRWGRIGFGRRCRGGRWALAVTVGSERVVQWLSAVIGRE